VYPAVDGVLKYKTHLIEARFPAFSIFSFLSLMGIPERDGDALTTRLPEAQRLTEDHDMIAAQEVDHGKRIQDESGSF
jgi:hypothetical protein